MIKEADEEKAETSRRDSLWPKALHLGRRSYTKAESRSTYSKSCPGNLGLSGLPCAVIARRIVLIMTHSLLHKLHQLEYS